jgi:hypothetical protein
VPHSAAVPVLNDNVSPSLSTTVKLYRNSCALVKETNGVDAATEIDGLYKSGNK